MTRLFAARGWGVEQTQNAEFCRTQARDRAILLIHGIRYKTWTSTINALKMDKKQQLRTLK